jgi:hypothetical protein
MASTDISGTSGADNFDVHFSDDGAGAATLSTTNKGSGTKTDYHLAGCRKTADGRLLVGSDVAGVPSFGFTLSLASAPPAAQLVFVIHRSPTQDDGGVTLTVSPHDADAIAALIQNAPDIPTGGTLREAGPEWVESLRALVTIWPEMRQSLLSHGWVQQQDGALSYCSNPSFTLRAVAGTNQRELRILIPAPPP